MKKNYLAMTAMAIGLLTFSACSSDDDFGGEQTTTAKGEMQDVELTFNIGVNSGKETRAGRPLYSAEALQRVNKMNVYYFKEDNGQYKYAGEVTSADNFGFQLTADEGNKTTQNTLKETLEEGASYKFLAIGLEDNGSAYSDFKTQLTAGTTVLENVKLTLGTGGVADEAFAGVSDVITITDGKASKNPIKIQLNRVVAGVLGYFKNVPYKVNYGNNGLVQVTKVVVKAVQKGTDVKYVDNGTTVSNVWAAGTQNNTAYDLITINLDGCTEVAGQNIYSNANYKGYGENNVVVEENSFVGGQFVLPVVTKDSTNTLVVELRGQVGSGEKVLKTFQVKKGGEIAYSLDANSFYSIGHKSTADGTNGENGDEDPDIDDPKDPDKDDDPVDLSKETYIELTVNAAWSAIYDLDLE